MQSRLISTKLELKDWQQTQNDIYFLAEAAINPFVRELALELHEGDKTGLYWQCSGESHASISSYLFKLTDWNLFAQRIAFQPNWGVLIRLKPRTTLFSDVRNTVLNHLREWTLVQTPEKEKMLLRISDFQVLKVLCSASNEAELNGIFDPILEFAYWQKGQETVEAVTGKRA